MTGKILIALLFLCSCKATYNGGSPASFTVVVRYYEDQTEDNVLTIINKKAILQYYDVSHPGAFTRELDVTCSKLNAAATETLWQELKQEPGVAYVAFK